MGLARHGQLWTRTAQSYAVKATAVLERIGTGFGPGLGTVLRLSNTRGAIATTKTFVSVARTSVSVSSRATCWLIDMSHYYHSNHTGNLQLFFGLFFVVLSILVKSCDIVRREVGTPAELESLLLLKVISFSNNSQIQQHFIRHDGAVGQPHFLTCI